MVERHSFRIVSGESRNCAFPQNFHTRKLGEITVFFAVIRSVEKGIVAVKFEKCIPAQRIVLNVQPQVEISILKLESRDFSE